jgi:hypothetical protein
MTLAGLSNFERLFDRVAPALILALGFTLTAAFVATVGA